MAIKTKILLLIYICVIPTVHADNDFTGGKPGIVHGCVTNSETNEGINGVTVILFNSSFSKSIATYTKGGSKCSNNSGVGTYYLEMPPGTYNMTFNKASYITQAREGVVLTASHFNEQNANIVSETGLIDITSTPAAANISIDGSLTGEVTPYTFTRRPGTYAVSVSKEGYLIPSTQTATVTENSTTSANFTLEQEVFGVSLVGDNSTAWVYTDEEAVYNLTIENTGNTKDTYALTYINLDNATVNLSNTNITLNQGALATLTLKVRSADAGTYQICVTATSLGDSTKSGTSCTTTDAVTRDTPSNTGSPGGGSSSQRHSVTDLTIFQEEIFTEDHLIEFMYKRGDTYGFKHAFNKEMGALASLYAAGGEKVTSTEMADAMSAAYPRAETNMLRVEGDDIYRLAVDYTLEHYSDPENLIIVRGDLPMDSLVATPLSALLDAPILLVEPDRIPEPDFEVLDRSYEKIYIIGGPAAVSGSVEQGLGNYSDTIIRIWGETRYETSVEVAREVRKLGGNDMAILTNGEKPVLYSATLSNMYLAPILYLDMPSVIQSTGTNLHQGAVSRYITEQALNLGMVYYNETLD